MDVGWEVDDRSTVANRLRLRIADRKKILTGAYPCSGQSEETRQLVRYSKLLRLSLRVTSGASAIFRMFPQVCL